MNGQRDLSDMILILKISGHWTRVDRFQTIFRLFQHGRALVIPVFAPFALAAVYYGGVDGLTKYAFFSIAGILMSQHAFYFIVSEDKLHKVANNMIKVIGKRKESWQQKIYDEEVLTLWRIIRTYLYICAGFIFLTGIAPILFDICLALFTDKKPFTIPTPGEPYLGENPQRSWSFYLINIVALTWCSFLTLHSIGTESMTVVFTTYICIELKILKREIDDLGFEINKGCTDYKDKLGDIIKGHQECLQLSRDTSELLGAPLVFQNVVSSMTITLLLYTALSQLKVGNYYVSMGAFWPFNCLTLILFVIAFMGEKVQDESLGIFNSLYDLPWYKMPVEFRKDLNMMIRQAAKPMALDLKNQYAINRATFATIANQAYSYLMLLESLE